MNKHLPEDYVANMIQQEISRLRKEVQSKQAIINDQSIKIHILEGLNKVLKMESEQDISELDGANITIEIYAKDLSEAQAEIASLKTCQCDGCAETLEGDAYCLKCYMRFK